MRLPAVSLAALSILVLTLLSRAQAPSPQQPADKLAAPQVLLRTSPDRLTQAQAFACPVSLDVRHRAGFGQVVAIDGSARKPFTQALDVTITNDGSSEIASLDVIVQVRGDKLRVMPLAREEDDLGERVPLHFDMRIKADKEAAASWSVASAHAVAYVEISKVTYTNGFLWSASNGSACQFTPNPLMLISSR